MEKIIDGCKALYKIEAGNHILYIIYNKLRWGLWKEFDSDELIGDYIWKETEKASNDTLEKETDTSYILNIASVQDFGAFENGIPDKDILDMQLRIFMPIIQNFMVGASTNQ